MRSFWANNSCCPTWTGLLSSYVTSHPPILLDTHPPPFPLHQIPGCTFGKATTEDIIQLPSFWEKWFSTRTSKCCIPEQRIRRSYDSGIWDIYVVRRIQTKEVVGSLVRRWITGFHVKGAYMPKAGIIDFFCVHPAWKKRGVGRTLLSIVHSVTPRPVPPHLMFWESYIPTIPPAVAGIYWRKECIVGKRQALADERTVWESLTRDRPIWSEYKKSEDILTYATCSGFVVIWNTWHRRIPQGDLIGIVLACTAEKSISEMYTCSPFGLLLADKQYEGWEFNGPFQWGIYNMNTGFISTEFPLVCMS